MSVSRCVRGGSVNRGRFARSLLAITLGGFAWLAPTSAHAQGTLNLPGAQSRGSATPGAGATTGRPTVTAVRAEKPPIIDGHLDDPIWRTATRIDTFVQERPVEGAPATEQKVVMVAYDSERIYFGIYAHYSNPSLIRANRAERDKTDNDDTVTVF